jgi:hypothetical protein
MPRNTLFRINITARQTNLLAKYPGASSVLRQIVESSPRRELKTRVWLLGNVTKLTNDMSYFRFGRRRSIKKPEWDVDHFVDKEDTDAPYSHIYINFNLEYFSISHNSDVSSSIDAAVRQLRFLFESTNLARDFDLEFEIRPVRNPTEFVDRLRKARLVRRFWFTVARPNIIDVGQVTRDLEKLTRDLGGIKTKAQTEGNINVEDAVELTRVAASNGQEAGASFRGPRDRRWTRASLGRNNIEFTESDEVLRSEKERVATQVAKYYRDTRDG